MKYPQRPVKDKILCIDCKVKGLITKKCKDNEFRCYMCSIHFNKRGKQ